MVHLPVRAGQRASWKRLLAHDPKTIVYSLTYPQYPNGNRIGYPQPVSVASTIRHL